MIVANEMRQLAFKNIEPEINNLEEQIKLEASKGNLCIDIKYPISYTAAVYLRNQGFGVNDSRNRILWWN